ncbi:MAG TPA: DUF4282 domain-containing protein [Caulobacteraceae bacterium]|jgi:hypothetical protein|nr:DUF4282 domain-containing protein [Caulobacteraceae bacterium]
MRASLPKPGQPRKLNLFWDLLTFDRLMTGPVIHLIYWCGLGLVCLFGFTVIGAAVGVAIRDGSLQGALLAIPVLVGGLLVIVALVLLWRGACEFFMAVFRIADDLAALRVVAERLTTTQQQPPAQQPPRY